MNRAGENRDTQWAGNGRKSGRVWSRDKRRAVKQRTGRRRGGGRELSRESG